MISGGFGLTKNIAFFLLWHLSSIITRFTVRKKQDSYMDSDEFHDIPKFLYYAVREEG
jgi:hypothetical protein